MGKIPGKVSQRLTSGLKRFQPIVEAAKARDVNEADTVLIVVDLLSELFGFDKYAEVTREYCVRRTFCDLAIKIDGKVEFLLEVKAIGLDLKDAHVKQVVDYAANEGVEWVAVTNGQFWRVFRVTFGKPIDNELVLDIDLLALRPRDAESIESLFLLTRESILKSALRGFHDQLQATNRYALAAILEGDPVLSVVRRELRRASPDIKIDIADLRAKIKAEVLKRDVIEGPDADAARRKVTRAATKMLRIRKEAEEEPATKGAPVPASTTIVPATAAIRAPKT